MQRGKAKALLILHLDQEREREGQRDVRWRERRKMQKLQLWLCQHTLKSLLFPQNLLLMHHIKFAEWRSAQGCEENPLLSPLKPRVASVLISGCCWELQLFTGSSGARPLLGVSISAGND